ncbi:Twin-arginine translocation pathway signal [Betaproteobacteria bacterium GR16-43]|nr:Twin-arginine translocation pathway signal [Betaproteobacteria bacterium GR16-43]
MSRFRNAAAFAALAFAGAAAAQSNFPSKPITLVVGFAAGGATDASARIIAKKLSENVKQSVIVDNKAGAGGNLAAQLVANAPPDGYTIHLSSVGPLSVAPSLVKNLPYDPEKDLAPLTMGVVFPAVFVVHPSVPAKNLTELVALAKKEPGTLNYASTGVGSASHLAGEMLKQRAGVDIVHIPYKGGGPIMTDLLTGRVTGYFSTLSTAGPHIEAGKLRAIATSGLTRMAALPNVPTVAEQGFPGFEAVNWYALVAPGKTPPAILDRLNAELVKVLKDPDVKKQLAEHGMEPVPMTRPQLAAYIKKEREAWAKVIATAGIKAD